MILKRGEIVNNTYTVKFFIGQGAFGEVYRVEHKFLGLQVLKILKAEYVLNSDLDTLIKEALILSKLTHENIVRVFETNTFEKEDKVFYFLAMEFVSGESLSDLLKREITLPVKKAIKIQTDFLQGLEKAHSSSIIHRDINPDNILLSYESLDPKGLLSDFGLAQKVNNLEKISNAAGRYLYFAPECFSDIYLPTSDVFSAGIVFYKMLTGTAPWEIELMNFSDFGEISKSIVTSRRKKPLAPSFFNNEISEDIDKVVLTSLELNIENRYKSGSDFLAAINQTN
jgi:serine/threonine-protein kinase